MVRVKVKPTKGLKLIATQSSSHPTIVFHRTKVAPRPRPAPKINTQKPNTQPVKPPITTQSKPSTNLNGGGGFGGTMGLYGNVKTTTTPPINAREGNGNGGGSSNGSSSNSGGGTSGNVPTTTGKKNFQHPLASHVKPTSLQVMITQAILSNGEPCSFDKIYEYVNTKWKGMKIKKRDGTPFSMDCKRAIHANLRHNPNQIALFKKDTQNVRCWRLCYTVEEVPTKPVPTITTESEKNRSRPTIYNGRPRAAGRNLRSNTGRQNSKGQRVVGLAELNELQVLISCAIEEMGDTATVTEINEYITRAINELRSDVRPVGIKEPRQAIIALLSKNGQCTPLFMRDPTNYLRWKPTEIHPWLNSSIEEKEQKLQEVNELISSSKEIDFSSLSMTECIRTNGSNENSSIATSNNSRR